MLSERMQSVLNKQIRVEAESSQIYLAMASWAELQGLEGVSEFMYAASDEERMHMLKLFKYINVSLFCSFIDKHAKYSALFNSLCLECIKTLFA